MDVSVSAWARSSITVRCSGRPWPRAMSPRISTSLAEPTRPGRRAHRDLVGAGPDDVAADADELQAGRPRLALGLEPLGAAQQDGGGHHERLDVVDDRRLVPEAVGAGEGRLVARLGPLALDRLQQRRLLAADVTAR